MFFDLAQKNCKIFKVHFWMNAADNMYFGNGLAIIFPDDIHHLIMTQFPTFFTVCIQPAIGTKITGKYANIGWFNVKIPVEIGLVAV